MRVDRLNIQFIIIYKPTYSLMMVVQMAGHTGRDGSESHVFFATSEWAGLMFKLEKDHSLVHELGKLVHEKECKILQMMQYLDGKTMAHACGDLHGQVPCNICEPNSEIHQFAGNAAANSGRTVPWLGDAGGNKLSSQCRKSVKQAYTMNMDKAKGKVSPLYDLFFYQHWAAFQACVVKVNPDSVLQYSDSNFGSDLFMDSMGQAVKFTEVALLPASANCEFHGSNMCHICISVWNTY